MDAGKGSQFPESIRKIYQAMCSLTANFEPVIAHRPRLSFPGSTHPLRLTERICVSPHPQQRGVGKESAAI